MSNDTREAFESWLVSTGGWRAIPKKRETTDTYISGQAQARWIGWQAATAQQAAEVQRLRAEVEQLKLAEEGAKTAFGHVVQMKRDAEAARDKTQANLDAAHAIIRQQARAARQDGAGAQG